MSAGVEDILINGAQYCRAHLRVQCHICEITYQQNNDELNQYRKNKGMRPCGDPFLDLVSSSCSTERDALVVYMTAKSATSMPTPRFDTSFSQIASSTEQDLNTRYRSIPECHICTNCGLRPTADVKLQRCSGCGIVCYCSRECQQQSWRAEHKVECRPMKVSGDMNEYIERTEKRLKIKSVSPVEPNERTLGERCRLAYESSSELRERTNQFVESQHRMDFTLPPWIERTSVAELESKWALAHS